MNILEDENKCSGCKACADICPVNAITFTLDECGYWYPHVDNKKCIKCHQCQKICPSKSNMEDVEVSMGETYAAWSKNDEIRRESTSGGIYYECADFILNQGGYIVGSVYSEDFCSAYHIISDQPDDLKKIMGSKYFQSDTGGIYKKTQELLITGKKVLFTGTPCQIAALKNFLGGQDYANLFTIDFICRGVPSPQLQREKINLYEKLYNSKVTYYRDKSKYYSWTHFGELIKFQNGKQRFISRWLDNINNCFIEKNLNLRECCYMCKFKAGKNASEITIGDFWGIDGVTKKDKEYGVSALIVNNSKGRILLDLIKDKVYLGPRDKICIENGNPAYVYAAERPKERNEFFRCISSRGLKRTVRKYTSYPLKRKYHNQKIALKSKMLSILPQIGYPKQLDWIQFIKYNYFCKQVKRNGNYYIYPYKGTIMQIGKKASIDLNGDIVINYYPTYKRGKSTALFKVGDGAKLTVNNRLELAYQTTFSLSPNANFQCDFVYTGVGTNIICNYKMTFGNNIMLGRDVCVFDSDYHNIYDVNWNKLNNDKEVIISDNVWIGARTIILKGTRIGAGAIISAGSIVMSEIEGERVFINKRESHSIGGKVIWKR